MTVKQCLNKKSIAGASTKVQSARRQQDRFKKTRTRSGRTVKR